MDAPRLPKDCLKDIDMMLGFRVGTLYDHDVCGMLDIDASTPTTREDLLEAICNNLSEMWADETVDDGVWAMTWGEIGEKLRSDMVNQ